MKTCTKPGLKSATASLVEFWHSAGYGSTLNRQQRAGTEGDTCTAETLEDQIAEMMDRDPHLDGH